MLDSIHASVLPVLAIALASMAWWHLYLADPAAAADGLASGASQTVRHSSGLHAASFYLLALGALFQSLMHWLLPAGSAVTGWGVLSSLAAILVVLLVYRRV